MAVSTIAHDEQLRVSIGVDTHLDTHVAVAKDGRGRTIGQTDIPTTPAGYRQVLAWAQGHGEVDGWAVEGTGSYGATEIGDIIPGPPASCVADSSISAPECPVIAPYQLRPSRVCCARCGGGFVLAPGGG